MIIGVLRVELYLNGNRSLKGKRRVLKSLIQRIRSRFKNVSISEVDSHDLWQRATIGISLVSNESSYVNSRLDQVSAFIYTEAQGVVLNSDLEIFHFKAGRDKQWEQGISVPIESEI